MLALQISGTFFVLVKIAGTKSGVNLVFCRLLLRGIATSLKFLGDRLWCRGSDTLRGGLLLLSRRRLFYG